MRAGLHTSLPLRDKLQQELARLAQLWRDLDAISRASLTPDEQTQLNSTLVTLEQATQNLGGLIQMNAGKPSAHWR